MTLVSLTRICKVPLQDIFNKYPLLQLLNLCIVNGGNIIANDSHGISVHVEVDPADNLQTLSDLIYVVPFELTLDNIPAFPYLCMLDKDVKLPESSEENSQNPRKRNRQNDDDAMEQ